MSTESASGEPSIETACRPTNVTPVEIDGNELEVSDTDRIRAFKESLVEAGYQPTTLRVSARFEEDCSLVTQREVDRLREYLRAAAFLGVTELAIDLECVSSSEKVGPALSALAERGRRDGVTVTVDGPEIETTDLSPAA